MGHHRADRAVVRERSAARAGHALSGALPSRASGPDSIRVEAHREQPACTLLRADPGRPPALQRRAGTVAADVTRGEPGPRSDPAGMNAMNRPVAAGWQWMRSMFRRRTLERGFDD